MATESTFSIETSVEDGKALVRLTGDADFTRVGVIDEEIKQVGKEAPTAVVVEEDAWPADREHLSVPPHTFAMALVPIEARDG